MSAFTSVYPYGFGVTVSSNLSHFQFLHWYYKMSPIKIVKYAFRVINMDSWLALDLWGQWCEEKPSYIHYIISQGEAKLRISKPTLVFHHLTYVIPRQLYVLAHLGCTHEACTP